MIEKMKKLELLLYHREREDFLESLSTAGVVHITEETETLSEKGEKLRSDITRADKVLREIMRAKLDKNISEKPQADTEKNGGELVKEFETILSRQEYITTEITGRKKDLLQLEAWGDFDPELLKKLEKNAIFAWFYDIPNKSLDSLAEYNYHIITDAGPSKYLIIFTRENTPPLQGIEPLPVPKRSLKKVRDEIADLENECAEYEEKKSGIAAQKKSIEAWKNMQEEAFLFERARLSMTPATENKVLHLTGWFPAPSENQVASTLSAYSCWYEFSSPRRDEPVPVKMKNRPGARLFEPITKIFDLPDYFELDPTPFIAPFYALFFGLCLGDVGYGFLMIVLAIVGMKLLPEKLKPVMVLGIVLGSATMFSGVLLNTAFGAPLFNGTAEGFAFFSNGGSLAVLEETTLEGRTVYPAMAFSVFLGIIQIILGMTLKAYNRFYDGGWKYTLFPFGTVLLTLSIAVSLVKINFLDMATFFQIVSRGDLMTQQVMHTFSWTPILGLASLGLLILFLFNNPDKKPAVRFPLGFWELYQFVTGIMGDGLSYIRLFALGLASGLLANAFNEIAFMASGDGAPGFMFIFTVLILLLGHSVNFILAGLGAFVHPLRLTFVEFYNNLEFNGGAVPYKPFSKLTTTK
jgi:V/A-type H+-transporting ATPase subunit I